MFIDVLIPGDGNVIKKEAKKILIYKELTLEIQRMWNVKANVIPVMIGATGTFQNNSNNTRATYREGTKLRNCNSSRTGHCTHCGQC
jgi:hypothetical protein